MTEEKRAFNLSVLRFMLTSASTPAVNPFLVSPDFTVFSPPSSHPVAPPYSPYESHSPAVLDEPNCAALDSPPDILNSEKPSSPTVSHTNSSAANTTGQPDAVYSVPTPAALEVPSFPSPSQSAPASIDTHAPSSTSTLNSSVSS